MRILYHANYLLRFKNVSRIEDEGCNTEDQQLSIKDYKSSWRPFGPLDFILDDLAFLSSLKGLVW